MNFLLKPITDRLKTLFPQLWVDRWHGQVGSSGYEYALPATFVETVRFRYEPGDRLGNRYTALIRFHVFAENTFESEAFGDSETSSLAVYTLPNEIELAFNNYEHPDSFRMERIAPGFQSTTPETKTTIDFNVYGWVGSGLNPTNLKIGVDLKQPIDYKGEIANTGTSVVIPIAPNTAWYVSTVVVLGTDTGYYALNVSTLKKDTGFEVAFGLEQTTDNDFFVEITAFQSQSILRLHIATTAHTVRYQTTQFI